jgi:ABC-2 type transport system permease protein/lipopolysaccharide transport system permease protein
MGVMVAALGYLYGGLLGHSLRDYLPYLAIGLILWAFLSSFITEGCGIFTTARSFIHQVKAPLSIHAFRLLWKNSIVFAHNAVIFLVVVIVFGAWPGVVALLALPALALICLNGFSLSILLGVLTARFRDIPPIVSSLVHLMFFVTPILWMPQRAPARAVFVEANPFFHLLNIVREPMLGGLPSLRSWCISLVITFSTLVLGGWMFARFRQRIAYWV